METPTLSPSGTLSPALVRDFLTLVSLISEAGNVVLTAAEAAGRTDLVNALLRGRQALATMRRELAEGGPQW